MYEITRFSAANALSLGDVLRKSGQEARSMEQVAQRVTQSIYELFCDGPTQGKSFVLVRLYKTHPMDRLPNPLQHFASALVPTEQDILNPQCLTLLGTSGAENAWNSPRYSKGHQAIPLFSKEFTLSLPMVSGLLSQLGLDIADVISPHTSIHLEESRDYNVFHVEQAQGSPLIPAQESFVVPYGVRSVIGFGGVLDSKSVFAVIAFSKHPISRQTAMLFRPLARNVKAALLPFDTVVFDLDQREYSGLAPSIPQQEECEILRSRIRVLEDILAMTEETSQMYSREMLDGAFQSEISRSARFSHPLSITLIEVDHLKSARDTYGYQIGDQVLSRIATLLRFCVRKSDFFGRWDGEKLVVICTQTNASGVLALAEKLRQAIATHDFNAVGHITSSFGVGTLLPNETADALVKRVDAALYRAKENGGNRVEAA